MFLIVASLNSLIRSAWFGRFSQDIKSKDGTNGPARRGRFSKRLRRRVVIFAVISSLQLWPEGLAFHPSASACLHGS
jgi:hypothetical protein